MSFTRRALVTAAAAAPVAAAAKAAAQPAPTLPAKSAFAKMPYAYLDSGSTHPMPLGAQAALTDYLRFKTRDAAAPRLDMDEIEKRVMERFGRLVGADPSELVFIQSTTMGENLVLKALGYPQTGGRIDGFVQSVGTAASFRGLTESLRQRNPRLKAVAVEPAESAVLSGGAPGAHKIDGVGAGFVVPLWRRDVADRIERVSTEDAVAMTLRLARKEGLFAGTSTGANVIAAMRLAEELGPDATVVTIMCDTGMKYLARLSSRGAEGDEG